MAATRRKQPAAPAPVEVNLDPYTFTHDGVEHTIPSFGSVPAGVIRKARHLDEADAAFAVIEALIEGDALDAVDSMVGPEFAEFVEAWQHAAGVDLPN